VCPETAPTAPTERMRRGPLDLPSSLTSLDALVSAPSGCNQSLFRRSLAVYWFVIMESAFKISYLLSRQTVEGDSYTNGKLLHPTTTTADIGFGKGPPALVRGARSQRCEGEEWNLRREMRMAPPAPALV